MRVLIIKTSALGDIIHALPVLDYLHQVVPGITVDWAVEEQFTDLLSGNPLLSELRVVRTRRWRRKPFRIETVREIQSLWHELRGRQYDYVFDIQGNLKSGIIAWATGVEQRIGFSKDHLQESANALFIKRRIPQRKEDDNAGGRYLRIVSVPFGKDYVGMKLSADIQTSRDEDVAAEMLIRGCGAGPVFLFHCGTTWQTKYWSEEGWARLGQLVCSGFPDAAMLFSWGNDSERAAAERLATAIGDHARVIGKFSLKGISALLKKVDVVVGGDTGLIHLAAALGTPTVSYYRASDGSVSGPRGSEHVIVQSPLACTRCQRTACDKDAECRASISAEAIYAGIAKIMNVTAG
jgi:heptosyltransferase I